MCTLLLLPHLGESQIPARSMLAVQSPAFLNHPDVLVVSLQVGTCKSQAGGNNLGSERGTERLRPCWDMLRHVQRGAMKL